LGQSNNEMLKLALNFQNDTYIDPSKYHLAAKLNPLLAFNFKMDGTWHTSPTHTNVLVEIYAQINHDFLYIKLIHITITKFF
jgi:hypothetical protein